MGPLRRPLALDFDYTLEQQESLAHVYYNRPARRGLRYALTRLHERLVWRYVSLFTPWSRWAADSLVRQGVDPARIRVQPPGVDLQAWQPSQERQRRSDEPMRLLFVGGDFTRKGGQILVDVLHARDDDRFELDIVTRDDVPSAGRIRVHRAEPNSPELRELYARADLFVLPTRAEAFGIATVEAMASGLPVIVSDVGGARDIVDDGETGWLIEPNADALGRALDAAHEQREQLPGMGARARAVAEQRFDGRRNDGVIVDMLLEEVAQARTRKETARRGHRQQI
jgi:glycosyltransferase involved in cell wall biosynthesis